MKRLLIMLILFLSIPSDATVEDQGGGAGQIAATITWPSQMQSALPVYPLSPCPYTSQCMQVTVSLSGPHEAEEAGYLTQGKSIEFLISVMNTGQEDVTAKLGISSQSCPLDWFEWTEESLEIPAGGTRSKSLLVRADTDSTAGSYDFVVDASSRCCKSNSEEGRFTVQSLDYASETAISGTGQFRLDKNVRSMSSGVKSSKDIIFSGSVDALVKNEYLVEGSKGKNPNFESQDAVDNYNAIYPGDSLIGRESFKSSAVFGGVGAKLQESYSLMQMEFESQSFKVHQTGSLKKTAEFKTADNFTGLYLIDAKQSIPGQRSLAEHEEYLGSFEINRKILFRNMQMSEPLCSDIDCPDGQESHQAPKIVTPGSSRSLNRFADALSAFSQSS